MSKYFEYMQERDEILENIKSSKELLSRLKRELKSLDDKIRDVIPEKKTTLDLTPYIGSGSVSLKILTKKREKTLSIL